MLYNNGKYITFDSIPFAKGMDTVVDMGTRPVRRADRYSRKWLKQRKFTDIVGERTLYKNYPTASPHKIMGYLFSPEFSVAEGEAHHGSSGDIFYYPDYEDWKHVTSSYDGYFELDVDNDSLVCPLKIFTSAELEIDAKANTWIFAVQGDGERPEFITTRLGVVIPWDNPAGRPDPADIIPNQYWRVEGYIFDPHMEPVAGASVMTTYRYRDRIATTDSDGYFKISVSDKETLEISTGGDRSRVFEFEIEKENPRRSMLIKRDGFYILLHDTRGR